MRRKVEHIFTGNYTFPSRTPQSGGDGKAVGISESDISKMERESKFSQFSLEGLDVQIWRLDIFVDRESRSESGNLSGHSGGRDDPGNFPCVAACGGAAPGSKQSAEMVFRIERPIWDFPDKSGFSPVGKQSDGVVKGSCVFLVLEHIFAFDAMDFTELRHHRKFQGKIRLAVILAGFIV